MIKKRILSVKLISLGKLSETTNGKPLICISSTAIPKPSKRDGKTPTSNTLINLFTLEDSPKKTNLILYS